MTEQDPESAALEKLQKMLSEARDNEFTDAERAALLRVVRIVFAIDALGSIGNWIKSVLLWLGVIIAAWVGFKNGLGEWLRALVS